MRRLFLPFLGLLCVAPLAWAQVGTEKQPVEITASGSTNYQGGIATATGNVAIHAGDADIYADKATYNPETHDIIAEGHVRIYRATGLFVGDRAIYNTETKEIRAVNIRTDKDPYLVGGDNVTSISEDAFMVSKGSFTTHDSSKPDFRLHSKRIRVYENDRVIFENTTFYVRNVPIFWWPYMYQSLDDSFSYMVSPAYLSSWGPSILGRVTVPITDDIKALIRLDYRSRRGVAFGFDPDIAFGPRDRRSWARIRTYFLKDENPDINQTSQARPDISEGRYRVSLQSRSILTEDIYAIANVTKLSDQFILEDFFQSEFQLNPQPDNVLALTRTNPNYTLTAIGRFQANNFFEMTERLPEVVLDVKRLPLFGGPVFYEGETGIAELHRNFWKGSPKHDYSTLRIDSFHQLTLPHTFFGWLSVVPRIGFRATYYDETRDLGKTIFVPEDNPFVPDFLKVNLEQPVQKGGGKLRTVFNGGVESSFKISRTWESAQNAAWGLDGLRHIIQPYTNFSWVSSDMDPAAILQFDRYQPSTQLRAIDFPQFTTIDSIDNWSVWRVGVRNRLQTRRDDATIGWMGVDSYIEVNLDNPFDQTQYSNLFNNFSFSPVPWATFSVLSQIPVFEKGFTEVNTGVSIQPFPNLQLSFSHRYLNANPFFDNSSLYVFSGYYRIDDNWGIGVQQQYEGITGVLEQQRYSIYRDLTSWVASVGAIIRDNGGVKEYGFLLTFTLKALPKFSFDLNFDPAGAEQTQ